MPHGLHWLGTIRNIDDPWPSTETFARMWDNLYIAWIKLVEDRPSLSSCSAGIRTQSRIVDVGWSTAHARDSSNRRLMSYSHSATSSLRPFHHKQYGKARPLGLKRGTRLHTIKVWQFNKIQRALSDVDSRRTTRLTQGTFWSRQLYVWVDRVATRRSFKWWTYIM
jgi:hypothetical protein